MPGHSSNEIEIRRKGRGTRESLWGEYIQGCDAVISRLEEGEGGQIDFSPLRGRMRNVSQGKQAEREKGREVWIQHFNKSHPRFCRRSSTMNFPGLNQWSTAHQPPTLATSLVTPPEHHHPSSKVGKLAQCFSRPRGFFSPLLGFSWVARKSYLFDGNFN